MFFLIFFPDKYLISISDGLTLYFVAVLPSLLPFFFFSKILCEYNFGFDIGKLMKKPLKKIYYAPSLSGYVLVMSMLSGYPVGAKLISDLYEKNLIDQKTAKAISTFTSTSGPLFILGTVGMSMLHSKLAGFIILVSHYLATLINGLIYRNKNNDLSINLIPPPIDSTKILSKSMLNSIISVALVGGYIAIFNMVIDVLKDIQVIGFFAKSLTLLNINYDTALGFVSSIVEVTKGCSIMSNSPMHIAVLIPLCTFAITFGGLCITLQSLTFLSKCKIKPAFYLLSKFTQALISMFISGILCYLFFLI
ncbi:MAG: hypothetical protein WCR54_06610 [Clostridia bacterium]